MKLKHILENKILVPRRSKEEREKNLAVVHYRQIQEYIKNGSKGFLDLNGTPLKTLPPNLIDVFGTLYLGSSQITSLGNLGYVRDNLFLDDSSIISLDNLKRVEGWLSLRNTPITSLGKLEYVGANLWLQDTQIRSLDNLKYVGWHLWLQNTQISQTHTEKQIRQQVRVVGRVYL
jgi:hypothetical protein